MPDIVNPLLQWLNANPNLAGLVTFLISAAESIAIIGTIVPGTIMMTALGALAGAGVIPLWGTLFWAILGAVVGDGVSYWIGYYFKDTLSNLWPFRGNPAFLYKGKDFIKKYGVMGVFLGRFVGPVRAIVPVAAGMLGMQPLRFTIANIISAIGWAPAYMLPGILLGAISFELPPDIAVHFVLALLMISLFIMLCLWFVYKLLHLINKQIEQMQIWIWHTLKKKPYFFPLTKLLKYYDHERAHGQLTLTFYFLLSSFLFCCLVYYVKIEGAANIFLNDALFHFFRGIRDPNTDSMMIGITLLGQKQIIIPVVVALFAWLIYSRRWRAAFHAAALAILAIGSIFLMKDFIHSPRPWGVLMNSQPYLTYSMPSGYATLSTTVFMGIAFLLASSVSPRFRWLIYLPAVLVTLAIGFSRIYLGVHWFTDIVGAWLLSAALLIAIIISYHRYPEKPFQLLGISIVCFSTLLLSYCLYFFTHFDGLRNDYVQIDWPKSEITLSNWWEENTDIPPLRVSLFGIPSEYINVEWVGDLRKINHTLTAEGWITPPEHDWATVIHRITAIRSNEFLPLIAPQYLDKKPSLILIHRLDKDNKVFVLRLWNANRTIASSQLPLWVGTIGLIPQTYHWLFKKNVAILNFDSSLLFPKPQIIEPNWEWKTITTHQLIRKNKVVSTNIILIKPK